MRLSWIIQLGAKSHPDVLIKEKEMRHRREYSVTREAGMWTWPQVKECQQSPDAGEARKGFSLKVFRGSEVLLTL